MPYTADDFSYGPVYVLRGKHKGRIGDLDNDDSSSSGKLRGIVVFAPFGVSHHESMIPIEYLQAPNTQQLLARYEQLWRRLTPYILKNSKIADADRVMWLEELAYVESVLNDRMFSARFNGPRSGAKIFLSHASADKGFVRGLAVDLGEIGHQPWLDEWEILGGESIPARIAESVEQADFMIVVLSKWAVESNWVEQEWQAKFWSEVNDRKITVIPILIDECNIPVLLRAKKYIDFRSNYTDALKILSNSIARHMERRQKISKA
jgi:TIR domain